MMTYATNPGDVIMWILSLVAVWATWSLLVQQFVERIKPTYTKIFAVLENIIHWYQDDSTYSLVWLRKIAIPMVIYAAALITVQDGGYNIFDGAPSYLRNIRPAFQELISAGFLAAGAFVFHRAADWLDKWHNAE